MFFRRHSLHVFPQDEVVLHAYDVGVHSHKTSEKRNDFNMWWRHFRIIFYFLSLFFSRSVLNESECIDLRGRMILIHECLTILYPSAVQKGPVDDDFSFPLSDFITHFLNAFLCMALSRSLSLPSLQNILRFSAPCV